MSESYPATGAAGGEVAGGGHPDATDAAVEEALSLLDGLARRPLVEHVTVLDAVHGALQDRLAEAQG